MDSSLWKINGTSAADRGLKDLHLSTVNQAPARLTFNADGRNFDSASLFDYGDDISLYKDAVRWFQGKVVSGPRFGAPDSESHDYEVVGLWERLERLDFIQTWRAGAGTISTTHVILGRNLDNNEWGVGPAIQEVLDYAIAQGAGIAYVQAEIDALAAKPPIDEQPGLKCSEAILKLLRWYPDVSTWIDYSPDTPVLHFTRRAAAAALQYNCTAGAPTEQIDIRALDGNVRSGVIINYERVDTVDGIRIPKLVQDIYPVGTVPGFDTTILTIAIGGNQQVTQSVKVETAEVGDYNTQEDADAWWLAHVPELAAYTNLEVKIPVISPFEIFDLPRLLVAGSVPEWTGKEVSQATWSAKISYKTANDSEIKEGDYTVTLALTDAETHTYTREVSFTPADAIPVGLAQALYEAVSQTHYQGGYNLLEDECSAGPTPGMVLNLTGGLTEWTSMRAVIQRVDFDIDSGRTTISYGPPEHLEPQDHIALLNANRKRITLYSGNARGDGEVDDADVQAGGGTPNSSGSGNQAYKKLVIDNDSKKITLDPSMQNAGMVFGSTGNDTEWVQGLPDGEIGDLLYNNGTEWVTLDNGFGPSFSQRMSVVNGIPIWIHPLAGLGGSIGQVLIGVDGLSPSWQNRTFLPDGSSGDVLYHDGTDWIPLALGALGTVLGSTGSVPAWVTPASGELPTGSAGDMLYHDGSGWESVLAGDFLDILSMSGGTPTWVTNPVPLGGLGEMLYNDSEAWVVVPNGAAGDRLYCDGFEPTWQDPLYKMGGTNGAILKSGGPGANATWLAAGSVGNILISDGAAWVANSGGSSVVLFADGGGWEALEVVFMTDGYMRAPSKA